MSTVRLCLVFPRLLEDAIVEFLLEDGLLDGGFTTLAGDGHGQDFAFASLSEKVRGRVHMVLLTAILPADDVPALLDALKEKFRGAHLRFWTERVESFGVLS